MKTARSLITLNLGAALLAGACLDIEDEHSSTTSALTATLTAPGLAQTGATQTEVWMEVCGTGTYGAPFGFSLQWMTAEAHAAGGWTDASLCKASFSGTPKSSINRFSLAAGDCTTVEVGNLFDEELGVSSSCFEDLVCGTDYVFRTFAHAGTRDRDQYKKSPFSANATGSTLACRADDSCTLTQGYWKNHNPLVCDSSPDSPLCELWPVDSLHLGSVTYSVAELVAIFNRPAAGNGLIALAHQLIAAKLNVANGADDSDVAASIAAADSLIGDLVVPPVGSGSLAPSVTSSLTTALDRYNSGLSGPGHCGG